MDPKTIEFIKQLGITSVWIILLVIIIGYLAKKLFELFVDATIDKKKADLSKELEHYKQELSADAQVYKLGLDKKLEEYKNNLQQTSQEHQIRFSKLHADRAETIKTLFSKLVKMEESMSSFVHPFQGVDEPSIESKAEVAADDGNDFLKYYHSNEILFNDNTCKIIDKLNDNFRSAYSKHLMHIKRVRNQATSVSLIEGLDPYFDILKNEIIKLKKTLTDDFRTSLGVL